MASHIGVANMFFLICSIAAGNKKSIIGNVTKKFFNTDFFVLNRIIN